MGNDTLPASPAREGDDAARGTSNGDADHRPVHSPRQASSAVVC